MTGCFRHSDAQTRAVRAWLLVVAGLIAIMVLVGGATRSSGGNAGCRIVVEAVTGTLPPLSEAQWTQAFEGYKAIPQYRELNAGMGFSEFKTVLLVGWSHRLLGRVIGAAYLLPFLSSCGERRPEQPE